MIEFLLVLSKDFNKNNVETIKNKLPIPEEYDGFLLCDRTRLVYFAGACLNVFDFVSSSYEWPKYAFERLVSEPVSFLREIEGYFSGIVLDTEEKRLDLFSDHLGTQPLYYCEAGDTLLVGSSIPPIAKKKRALGGRVECSAFGAYSILCYSFLLDDYTPVKGIKKVLSATLVSLPSGNKLSYFSWLEQDRQIPRSLNEIADGIHERFSRSVKLNCEYKSPPRHLFLLSGGLDSRMSLFYARDCGYNNLVSICYSQTGYREETIASKVANACDCEHFFFPLDGGRCLELMDQGIVATQGMTTYRPIASARSIWSSFDLTSFPLIHNGLLGDTIIGGYCIDKCHADNRFESAIDLAIGLNPKNESILGGPFGSQAVKYFNLVQEWIKLEEVNAIGQEEFILKNRYLNGLLQSYLGVRGYSLLSLPFASKELLEYIYSYSSSIRTNHRLYFKWMKRHMPEAGLFRWENTGLRPIYGPVEIKPNNLLSKLFRSADNARRKNGPEATRNPYRYWMSQNKEIAEKLRDYCKKRMYLLEENSLIRDFVGFIVETSDIYCLTRVITLLGLLERCFE